MTAEELLARHGPRETMDYDVVVVGAGPAGLAAAIRLKQLAAQHGREVSVAVLEKGSEPGAHILSGAVMDPIALDELVPDWKDRGAPLNQPVTADEVLLLGANDQVRAVPPWLVPDCLHNEGNYVISLGALVKWLAQQAETAGVEVFPGFAAAEVLYDAQGAVRGVATGNLGIGRDGEPHEGFQLGMELTAKYTVFAEGARGHLGRQLIARHGLDEGRDTPTFAIGIKELWEVEPARARPGLVVHTSGWPIEDRTVGGGFLYHQEGNRVALGYVLGLDYRNAWMSPFEEMQRWKTHAAIRRHIEGGQRIGYGARAINNGSLSALPRTVFPGGVLVGCDAGFLNAARIKGSHTAIKSGMLAGQAAFEALAAGRARDALVAYPAAVERSWLRAELAAARNFKPWFKKGRNLGQLMTGIEHWLLPRVGVKAPPWTVHVHKADHEALQPSDESVPIAYPKPDGQLTFDRLSSIYLSNVNHEENQPPHLRLRDPAVPLEVNRARFAGPETRYCPAGVYEYVADPAGQERLQINAQNCLHCKTCDIKDPAQNIVWLPPEGGGGPNYVAM